MNVNDLVESVNKFYEELKSNENGRFRSWEHCYKYFYEARKNDKKDNDIIDYLSLHLAFYLASWGMYRGSSFLLQYDYRIHREIVAKILKPDYDCLIDLNCKKAEIEKKWDKIEKLNDFIKTHYPKEPTDTLITKILLGTLGCVPAYDRYFVAGLKEQGLCGAYGVKSLKQLASFYDDNYEEFEKIRKTFKVSDEGLLYPQMKLLDMMFWKKGVEKTTVL